ncbi:MAG: glucose-1-phosphate cytidylyltransferase [Candidatus Eiseniibacteriota bacterium]
MKTVILAGGLGTRLAEETSLRPKPMVEIGGMPILWHIMKIYAHHGFDEFLVALGYRGDIIKQYFLHFYERTNDLTVDLGRGDTKVHSGRGPSWRVHLVDTGADTMTGGRIKRLSSWIGKETFMATYGDGLGDVPIRDLLAFHKSHGKAATVTGVHPPTRFGLLGLTGQQVTHFEEKPAGAEGWVNGGFFVFESKVFDYIEGDGEALERAPLERLSRDGELMAYTHRGFWQPMDTLRDKQELEALWASGRAPWKVWD